MQQTLVNVLGQGTAVTSDTFWNNLEAVLKSEQPFPAKLTMKQKQKLVEAVRHAPTRENPGKLLLIVNELLERLASAPSCLAFVAQGDASFPAVLASYVGRVMNGPSDEIFLQAKTGVLKAIDPLILSNETLKKHTAKPVLGAIVQVLKDIDADPDFLNSALVVIFKMVEGIEECKSVIVGNASLFKTAMTNCRHPQMWMRLANILWLANVIEHHTDDNFWDHLPDLALRSQMSVLLALELDVVDVMEKKGILVLIIGTQELTILNGSNFVMVKFESIVGLNLDGLVMTIDIADPDGVVTQMNVTFTKSPTSEQVKLMFSRISNGESQPELSPSENEGPHRPKSSIAMFQPSDAQNPSLPLDEALFSEVPPTTPAPDEPLPPKVDEEPISSPLREPTPPPPHIESRSEPFSVQMKFEPDNFDAFGAGIAEKVANGISCLTKSRMDAMERFTQKVSAVSEVFKEDLKNAMRDREHGSVKQLDTSREQFLSNIRQFKRKAGAIHQNLVGIEEQTQKMSSVITDMQKTIRKELQQRKIDLEEEIKRLRKTLRSQSQDDDSPQT